MTPLASVGWLVVHQALDGHVSQSLKQSFVVWPGRTSVESSVLHFVVRSLSFPILAAQHLELVLLLVLFHLQHVARDVFNLFMRTRIESWPTCLFRLRVTYLRSVWLQAVLSDVQGAYEAGVDFGSECDVAWQSFQYFLLHNKSVDSLNDFLNGVIGDIN